MKYTKVKLGDVSIGRKGTYGIPASAVPFSQNLYAYLRITDINDDGTLNESGRVSVDDPKAADYMLQTNDIVFARTGNSTGRNYFYNPADGPLVYAGFLIKFSIDPEKVNPKFIKYFVLSDAYKAWVSSFNTGSTRGNINAQTFANMEIDLPPRSQQDTLVKILSGIDEKIRANKQINHNLEEQAKAIFRHYFSQCNNVTHLGKICTCVLGGTPSREKDEYWNGNIPWINSGKVNEFRITDPSEYITKIGLEHSATKMLPKHTTVLAITGATLGQVSLLEIESCANQSVVGIIQNKSMPYTFIYPFVKEHIQSLIANQTGGAQQHINKQNVESLLVPTVDAAYLQEYDKNVSPIFEHIGVNCFESMRLAQLRDSLLPKLMTGEIDVSEVMI